MKYTHNEMINKFPIVFEYYYIKGSSKINENFGFLSHSYESKCNSLEEAKNLINKDWTKRKEESANIYEEYFKEYNDYSLIKKLLQYTNFNNVKLSYERAMFEYIKEPEVEIVRLNENFSYNFVVGELKEGQNLYIVVTSENLLPVGLHKVVIDSLEYKTIVEKNKVSLEPNGIYKFLEGDNDSMVRFNYADGILNSNYSYHNIFIDKNEAIKYYQDFLNEQKNNIEKEIQKTNSLTFNI